MIIFADDDDDDKGEEESSNGGREIKCMDWYVICWSSTVIGVEMVEESVSCNILSSKYLSDFVRSVSSCDNDDEYKTSCRCKGNDDKMEDDLEIDSLVAS